jgi:hypothetical protein
VASFDGYSHDGASDEDDDATDYSASDDDTTRVNRNHVQVRIIQVPVIAPAAATPIRRAATAISSSTRITPQPQPRSQPRRCHYQASDTGSDVSGDGDDTMNSGVDEDDDTMKLGVSEDSDCDDDGTIDTYQSSHVCECISFIQA